MAGKTALPARPPPHLDDLTIFSWRACPAWAQSQEIEMKPTVAAVATATAAAAATTAAALNINLFFPRVMLDTSLLRR